MAKHSHDSVIAEIQRGLFALQDLKYKAFISKLIPTLPEDVFIGVRTPALRKFAAGLKGEEQAAILNGLPHQYYEENQIHGFIIEKVKDFAEALRLTEGFLPYIDNWATCDQRTPKVFSKHPEVMYQHILRWLKSDHEFTQRYAMGLLMSNYMDKHFKIEHLDLLASHDSEAYYVKMMVAWYFSMALVKQYEATLPYLERSVMEKWTHNKAIQKAIESYQISDEQKAYLRTLRK